MTEEYNCILNNDVWEIMLRSKGKFVIDSTWSYKVKLAAKGSIEKYKIEFIDRGFLQKEVVNVRILKFEILYFYIFYIPCSPPVYKFEGSHISMVFPFPKPITIFQVSCNLGVITILEL